MTHRHITGISQALHCVFIQSSLKASTGRHILRSRRRLIPVQIVRHVNKYAQFSKSNHLKLPSHPVNEDIGKPDKLVNLVNNDGEILQTLPLGTILRRLDRQADFLVRVKDRNFNEPSSLPQVQILPEEDLMEMATRVLRQESLDKKNVKKNEAKSVTFSWVISNNDLAHRVKTIKGFLEDGLKVEVLITGRRGMVQVTAIQRQAFLERIRESLLDVEGLREYREMEGKLERTVTLFFDSPIIFKRKTAEEKQVAMDAEEKPKKLSRYQARLAEREKRKAEEEALQDAYKMDLRERHRPQSYSEDTTFGAHSRKRNQQSYRSIM